MTPGGFLVLVGLLAAVATTILAVFAATAPVDELPERVREWLMRGVLFAASFIVAGLVTETLAGLIA